MSEKAKNHASATPKKEKNTLKKRFFRPENAIFALFLCILTKNG